MTQSTTFAQVATNQFDYLSSALCANTPPYKKHSSSRKFLTSSISLRLLLVMFLTLSVTTNAWGAEVTAAGNIVNGNTYYIKGVRSNNTYYLKFTDSNGSQKGTEASSTNDAIPITFIAVNGGWNLKTPNGNYIAPGTSNGTINVSTNAITVAASNYNSKIRLSIVNNGTTWSIQKNTSTANFGGYKNTQTDITLVDANVSTPVNPTITFSNGSYTVGGAALELSTLWESNSTGSVTYSITNAGTTGATINGTSFTATAAGTCTVQASQAATAAYKAATATATIIVNAPTGGGGEGECTWQLVTDDSSLKVGDEIVIAAKDYSYAISTTQNNNNRGQAAITKSGSTISEPSNSVQILTLKEGSTTNTFAFYTGSQYLYAASSSNNYLRSQDGINGNASWGISINNDNSANICATGTSTRNVLRYNQTSSLFSCYEAEKVQAVVIYKKVCAEETDCNKFAFSADLNTTYECNINDNLTLTVDALYDSKASNNITYQWYSNTTNSTTGGTVITGSTSASYQPSTDALSEKYYYCVASYKGECEITSKVAWVKTHFCDNYTFHTGGDGVKETNTPTCFTQVSSTTEWQITNYTIPSDTKFFVGKQGWWYDAQLGNNNSRSVAKTWSESMYLAPSMDASNANGSPKVGQAAGAVGTLRIFDDSNWDNLYVGFIPNGYKLKFGTTEYAFTHKENSEYLSDIVEYNATSANYNASAGITNVSGDYVATDHTQEMRHIFVKDNIGWRNDGAKLAIYYWNGSTNGWCGFLKTVPGDATLFEGWIPASYTSLKFVRFSNTKGAVGDWNDKWNETGDLTISSGNNLFTITDWGTGSWSAYSRKGKYRIYNDSKDKNWYLHFYPHNVLIYDANSGSGTMASQSVPADATSKSVTVSANGFTRSGYRFTGWNTKANGSGTPYAVGASLNLTSDITLYAQWAQEFTVTYNANGGTTDCEDDNTYIQDEMVIVCSTNPSQTGYTFKGWSDGTNTYNASGTFLMPANNVTLIAQWQINSYTVTWDPNGGNWGGSPENKEETYNYGAAITTPADPTREGYQFDGWHNGTSIVTPVTTMPASNLTYTAQWTPIYTIIWLANGQEFHKQENAVEGTALDVPDSEPDASEYACDDKVFVGWTATKIDGSTDTEPADLFKSKTDKVENAATTYYAVFAMEREDGVGTTEIVKTETFSNQTSHVSESNWQQSLTWDAIESNIGVEWSTYYGKILANDDYVEIRTYSNKNMGYIWSSQKIKGLKSIQFNGWHVTESDAADMVVSYSKNNDNDWVEIGTHTAGSTSSSQSAVFTIPDAGVNDEYYISIDLSNATCPSSGNKKYRIDNISLTILEGSGSTISYSDYSTTCIKLPDPVWNGATIDKTALTVNCGERSPMTGANGAAIISFPTEKIYNFTKDITIEATTGFLVSTSQTEDANYKSLVSLSPLVGTANANTFYDKHVYVRAEAPAQSDTDLEGTITIKDSKGETLQTFSVTADVTCTQYTLTLVDRGVSTEQATKYYAGETIDEAPADPEGVCTDPIHYVFDGWAAATVSEGATEYTKVAFPYTVTGNTKFYAVYRYVEEGSADSGDYVKVTEDLDDYSGDYLIVYETGSVAFDGGLDELDEVENTISVTINSNTIESHATTDAAKFTIAKVDGGYSIKSTSGYYIGWSTADKNGLNSNSKYSANYYLNTISNSIISGVKGTLKFNKTSGQERFRYYQSGQETIALYRKAASYLYTTSPVCGPHLVITEGKDIYVTGGNAGGTRDLVIAQQKVSYKATRLNVGPTSQVPDVKVATNGITVGGVVTSDVKVTIDQTKEQQTDGTYTITGTITVQYQPSANNKQEDIQVQMAVDYNADARDNFTVHARSLPAEFVIVAKSGDKWYALNGDMNNGSSANPANGQVTLDDDANPTEATYAPCNAIYTFDGLPNTGDRTYVRFQGTDGAWLWASSGTNVGIQNNVLKTTPEGSNKAYNWKLYTEDNITYRFGNANSSRQLTLNGEKFGMYASGVQDIRILPYVEKCLYNYAPSNLKVSVLKGSYVTLTWDAVAGATKYQYSDDATNWTDAGTEPTMTINGLNNGTNYTYYIRAYHADAGVSQECFDYSEITFTTADCDDVPTDITYTADLNSITVSWTASAATATVKLYSDETGTTTVQTLTDATSPCKFTDLTKNTTYYVQVFSGGTCASQIIKVSTEDVEVEIVEWFEQGIIVDINTDETVGVTLENEVSYGSGTGSEATELFFSKYYEATTNVKLVAIYNGTKNLIDLTEYEIHYGKTSWESNYITLKDFGATKGQIQPGEEIILYSKTDGNTSDERIMDCVHDDYPDGKWVQVTQSNNEGKGHLAFAGDKTIVLKKAGTVIDVIGALTSGGLPTNNAVTQPSWGDANGWTCATGLSVADDTQIGISTNRCLLIRNNTVTSGENAVTSNIDDFVTLCSEWKGAQVPDNNVDNGVAASCENFAYVGTFDYSDYYTQYESMGDEKEFDENARNADGTVTIPITDLYKQSCRNIRVKLSNADGDVLTDREYKVPIMISTTQGTDGQTFLDLQQNLATKEVDGDGNVINTHPLSLEEVREICKTCDVVVRDNATLTKVTDGTTNDHPQVHDVIVYEGASIVIPDGTDHNYTINSLSLRRKGDDVASAQVQGTGKLVLPTDVPVSLNMRIDANNWHWFTLPYDCDIADVTWSDGTPAKYNTDWFLMYYDGESRAASTNPHDNHWKVYSGTTIEAGKGYIIGITGDLAHPKYTFELRFPMAQEVLTDEQKDKTVALNAWGVQSDNTPNNKGWNLVGNPYLNYYQPKTTGFSGLSLLQYTGIDPVTGDRLYVKNGEIPFLVTPIDGGWYEYQQELASDVQMMPFTAYFVQVGDPGNPDHTDGKELNASFEASNRGKKSILHRAQSEVDELEDPAIVAVSLTNAKGESDKTTLLIADRFTNEYEMNADFFKWFGDYYKYYTKPVLYTIGADQGKRAFNALNEDLATQPISLGMYAAQAGNYTFSLNLRNELAQVQEVWLYDATQDVYTNLLQDDYTFHTAKTESAGRFFLSVKMAPKVTTDTENLTSGSIWATTHNKTITINGLLSNSNVWVYDATGKLLHADQTQYFQHSFSVPQTGAYFVRVQNTMQTQTIKVVVE